MNMLKKTPGDMFILRMFFFFLFGFTPCKAEQPLRGMELQEKEAQNTYRKSVKKEPIFTRCLLILDLSHLDHKSKESILQAENSRI